jgi:hypothetical protein
MTFNLGQASWLVLIIIYFETERVPKCNQCTISVMHVRYAKRLPEINYTVSNIGLSLQYKPYATGSKRWWCIALHSRGFCKRIRPGRLVTIMAAGNGRPLPTDRSMASRSISYLWSSYHIIYTPVHARAEHEQERRRVPHVTWTVSARTNRREARSRLVVVLATVGVVGPSLLVSVGATQFCQKPP